MYDGHDHDYDDYDYYYVMWDWEMVSYCWIELEGRVYNLVKLSTS